MSEEEPKAKFIPEGEEIPTNEEESKEEKKAEEEEVEDKDVRVLTKISENEYKLELTNEKHRLHTIQYYKKDQLKKIYEDNKTNVNNMIENRKVVMKQLKEAKEADTPEIKKLAEDMVKAAALAQLNIKENELAFQQKQIKDEREQMKLIASVIPELNRNK